MSSLNLRPAAVSSSPAPEGVPLPAPPQSMPYIYFIDRILMRSMLFPGDYIKIFESVVDAYQKQLGAIAITVRIHAHSVKYSSLTVTLYASRSTTPL
jgi:hypothetical protein